MTGIRIGFNVAATLGYGTAAFQAVPIVWAHEPILGVLTAFAFLLAGVAIWEPALRERESPAE